MSPEQERLLSVIHERAAAMPGGGQSYGMAINSPMYFQACEALANLGRALDAVARAQSGARP